MQEVKMSAKNDLAVFALPVILLKNAAFRLQLNFCKTSVKKSTLMAHTKNRPFLLLKWRHF